MTHLSINLNKIALLRNSRGKNFPAPEDFGKMALELGVFGLTLHPRPDERHARFSDLPLLGTLVSKYSTPSAPREFNVEGYPSEDFLSRVIEQKPHQCTLVPDAPDAITSDAGWDFVKNKAFLKATTERLKSHGIRVSLFLDPYTFTPEQLIALKEINPERIELYTEKYALDFGSAQEKNTVSIYKKVADQVTKLGIDINAGHDLNQRNLGLLIREIPQIKEVSIGHALIVEALLEGFSITVKSYLQILKR